MRHVVLLLAVLCPVLAGAFQLDWSGYYKANALFLGDPIVHGENNTPFLFKGDQQLFSKF